MAGLHARHIQGQLVAVGKHGYISPMTVNLRYLRPLGYQSPYRRWRRAAVVAAWRRTRAPLWVLLSIAKIMDRDIGNYGRKARRRTVMRTPFLLLIIFWMLVLSMWRVHADELDVRPVWTMTCFPSSRAPYEVTANHHTHQLIITSSTGRVRSYSIVDSRQVLQGFAVTAIGWGRRINAGFSATKGMLQVDGKYDFCGGDL